MAQGQACDCKRNRLWVRFPLEKIKYLMFSFLNSDDETERGVEVRHPIYKASRIQLSSIYLPCYSVKRICIECRNSTTCFILLHVFKWIRNFLWDPSPRHLEIIQGVGLSLLFFLNVFYTYFWNLSVEYLKKIKSCIILVRNSVFILRQNTPYYIENDTVKKQWLKITVFFEGI